MKKKKISYQSWELLFHLCVQQKVKITMQEQTNKQLNKKIIDTINIYNRVK